MDQENEGFTEKDALCILRALPEFKDQEQDPLFPTMRSNMKRVGLSVEDLDGLNIIHITGTKGKGSTCAYTEQILRNYGFRTGFFSSPHLVTIRERIRINGQPIGKELFSKYFMQVYRQLDETKDSHGGAMPIFFVFLTLLAFRVFLEEKVDVAVIEVGIGGQCDCTNVIRRPWVCGISSLGIDHIDILGDTIEKIAWHKGGIFKPDVPAFTVKQPEVAMAVLRERANEFNCPLRLCPDLDKYQVYCGPLHLSLAGQHQHSNASLALQLSHTWLQRRFFPDKRLPVNTITDTDVLQGSAFEPSSLMVKGLADTMWPGRAQTLKHGAVTYFLDGAHTIRSMQACACWFKETSTTHERNTSGPVTRVLMFSISGERDPAALLKQLVSCDFDFAVFCPYLTDTSISYKDINVSMEEIINRSLENERIWKLHNSLGNESSGLVLGVDSVALVPGKKADTLVLPSILGALQWITQGRDPLLADLAEIVPLVQSNIQAKADLLCDAAEIHVLVTGSLHLVGGALKYLDPASYE